MYVTEDQVRQLLSVPQCIEVLRRAFSLNYVNVPRHRLKSANGLLHMMSASIPDLSVMGLKTYSTTRKGNTFVVLLFHEANGSLLATLEANALGQIRTGAASGLATDLLARKDARLGAIIGTGFQAEKQLVAIDTVRTLEEIRIYSRSPEKRKEFVARMASSVRGKLIDVGSAEECVRDADVICTITSSREPVLFGEWLKPGCHINAAGSNWINKRELNEDAVNRCDLICVDHREQSKIESGDLVSVLKDEDWSRVVDLSEVVKGLSCRNSPDQITLFKSNGVAIEDIAAAQYIYSRLRITSNP